MGFARKERWEKRKTKCLYFNPVWSRTPEIITRGVQKETELFK